MRSARPMKGSWPTPLAETLDYLLSKAVADITAKDFVRVVGIAQDLLAEKKKARIEKKATAHDRVIMRDAVGNQFPFQLSRIGWKVGEVIPTKIELHLKHDPRAKRVYRLTRADDWHGRFVYEEIV